MPIDDLLALTDFSTDAVNAVERAARIAAEQRARLRLLHVLHGPSLAALSDMVGPGGDTERVLLTATQDALAEIAADIGARLGVAVTTDVRIGGVLAEIHTAARSADLLALGAHGVNPVRDAILGTTAERLLGKCRCPALVVKQPVVGPYSRVVVPVDFSSGSPAVLAAAMRIAPEAEIHVLHAFHVPFEGRLRVSGATEGTVLAYRAQSRTRALASIMALIKQAEGQRTRRLLPAVEHGDVTQVLLQKAADLNADLIAIGRQGRNTAEDFLFGSVTRHVLADAGCDVLVVGEPAPAAE